MIPVYAEKIDTLPINTETNRKTIKRIDTISIFDTWKLSFSVNIKENNAGMPGHGGQKRDRYDISEIRYVDTSKLWIRYPTPGEPTFLHGFYSKRPPSGTRFPPARGTGELREPKNNETKRQQNTNKNKIVRRLERTRVPSKDITLQMFLLNNIAGAHSE